MADNHYTVGYATTARAQCKDTKCKKQIEKDNLRIGKIHKNPFHEETMTTSWYHPECMFASLHRARAQTKKIDSEKDLEGFDELNDDDKQQLRDMIKDFQTKSPRGMKGKSLSADEGEENNEGEKDTLEGSTEGKRHTEKSEGGDDQQAEKESEMSESSDIAEKGKSPKQKRKAPPSETEMREQDEMQEKTAAESSESTDEVPVDGDVSSESNKKLKLTPKGEPLVKDFVYMLAAGARGADKFWEAKIDGSTIITRFGTEGHAGREISRHTSDDETAKLELASLIKEKMRKGYKMKGEELTEIPPEMLEKTASPVSKKSALRSSAILKETELAEQTLG